MLHGVEAVQHDRCRPGVANAGRFAGFLDSVVVVAGAFHCSRHWPAQFAVDFLRYAPVADMVREQLEVELPL